MVNRFYFTKYLDSIVNNLGKVDDNIVFIKRFSDNAFSEDDIVGDFQNMNNTEVLFHQFYSYEIQNPYEPFFDWISLSYKKYFEKEMTVEEFVDECNIYSLQKATFVSMILGEMAKREYGVIINEIKYESYRFRDGIISVLEYIMTRTNLVFVLNNLHYANYSTMVILNEIFTKKKYKKLGILAVYDGSYSFFSNTTQLWEQVSILIENNNYLVCWEDKAQEGEAIGFNRYFTPKASKMDIYIMKIKDMCMSFAYIQASMYIDTIIDSIKLEKLDINKDTLYRFYDVSIYVKLSNNDFQKVFVICSYMQELIDENNDFEKTLKIDYYTALAYIYSSKTQMADIYVKKCRVMAEKINKKKYYILTELIECLQTFYGMRFMMKGIENVYPNEKRKLLLENGYPTVAGLTYIYSVENDGVSIQNEYAKNIARRYGDEQLYAMACSNCIIKTLNPSESEKVSDNYLEAEKVFLKYNDMNSIIELNLTIGYKMMMLEKYIQANIYFNNAIESLYAYGDAEKISEGMYNMGINYIFLRKYEKAYDMFLTAYKICKMMHIDGLVICRITKLISYIALSACYMNNMHIAHYYMLQNAKIYTKMIDREGIVNWEEDLFLHYLVNAMVCVDSDELEDAELYFESAKKYMILSRRFKFFSVYHYTIERYKLHIRMNQIDEAKECVQEGIRIAEEMHYEELKKTLINLRDGLPYLKEYDVPEMKYSVKKIIQKASYSKIKNKYNSTDKNIDFLYSWQNLLNDSEADLKIWLDKNMLNLKNKFSIDGMFLYEKINDDYCCIYENTTIKIDSNKKDIVNEFIKNNDKDIIIIKSGEYEQDYEHILEIFSIENMVYLLGIPYAGSNGVYYLLSYCNVFQNFGDSRMNLGKEDIFVARIGFGQLIDSYELYKDDIKITSANEKLQDMAMKDILTGIYNRNGFKKRILEVSKEYDKSTLGTLLYIDLDNFKHYNDTYGHEAGDTILTKFADILSSCIDGSDMAIRYGGDEFLYIAVDKCVRDAEKIASKINRLVENQLRKYTNSLALLEKREDDIYITCSIGISQFKNNIESFEKALSLADTALYDVKKNKKGEYRINNAF